MATRRRVLATGLALMTLPLLQGCEGCQETSQNLQKMVWIKYAHIANVSSFQPVPGPLQYASASRQGFWAVFEVCSIDVQGSALSGFNYDPRKFVIPWGSAQIGSATPGIVARSDATGLTLPNAEVSTVVRTTFEAGPITQYLPKQLYLKPGFRFAIFLNTYPAGYQGEPMQLQYLGQPEVAAVVDQVEQPNPQPIAFYNHGISPGIGGYCP